MDGAAGVGVSDRQTDKQTDRWTDIGRYNSQSVTDVCQSCRSRWWPSSHCSLHRRRPASRPVRLTPLIWYKQRRSSHRQHRSHCLHLRFLMPICRCYPGHSYPGGYVRISAAMLYSVVSQERAHQYKSTKPQEQGRSY